MAAVRDGNAMNFILLSISECVTPPAGQPNFCRRRRRHQTGTGDKHLNLFLLLFAIATIAR